MTESQQDAHCMNCKRAWNDEFLDMHFTKAFRTGPWKKHREKVLFDRELALLPTRQPRVEATLKMRAVGDKIHELNREYAVWEAKRKALYEERQTLDLRNQGLQRLQERFNYERRGQAVPAYLLDTNAAKEHKKERAAFIMKCPDGECRGFLSTAYKCGTCQNYACKDCLDMLGKERDETHVCNEEKKASVSLIVQESKPCPKCGTRISKVDGCDQMFCIECHTAFSWNTGQQVNGVIHNPHYYEWLRKSGGGHAPRVEGDVPCGGLPPAYMLITRVRDLGKTIMTQFQAIHRLASEIADERIHSYLGQFNVQDNGDLGVLYLMKEIEKEAMQAELIRRERKRERHQAIRAVLEMFVNTATMWLNAIVNGDVLTHGKAREWIDEFEALRKYVNESLLRVSVSKGCSVPLIGDIEKDYTWVWSTFNKVTSGKKVKGGAAAETSNAGGAAAAALEPPVEYDE